MTEIDHFEFAPDVPVIDIRLDDYPAQRDLWDKELYLDATVNIDGAGRYEDVEEWNTKIKGRGNTTWYMKKKPYRFKASKKISLLGMKKAKSYALIANYIDGTHMRNFVALTLASKLGMPFTNSCVPVRVRLNGIDKGLYMLTEKIGTGGASVDIDEETGWLLEMDTAMDEEYVYRSEPFNLPVMLKDPDLAEIYENPDGQWEIIMADFNNVLRALQNCKDESWRDVIDAESLINYLLVNNFVLNMEVRHPKSVYLYKAASDDRYHFGPVWDFDWSCGYAQNGDYTNSLASCLLDEWHYEGSKFFRQLTRLPGFMDEFRSRWDVIVSDIYPDLLTEMDNYAALIRPAAKSDGVIWPDKSEMKAQSSFDFDARYDELRQWIADRVAACNADPNRLLIK